MGIGPGGGFLFLVFPVGPLGFPGLIPVFQLPPVGVAIFAVIVKIAVRAEDGLRHPQPQTFQNHGQLFWVPQGGDLGLAPVVQNVQLQIPGHPHPAAAGVTLDLIPAGYHPHPIQGGDIVPQNPLPAHRHLVKPLAVGLDVLVHHGEQLRHRGRFLRVGQLVPDGLGQPAFFGAEGVPQVQKGQIAPQPHHQQGDYTGENPGAVFNSLPGGEVLEDYAAHKVGPHQEAQKQEDSRHPQLLELAAGALEAVAFGGAVGLLLFVPGAQNQNHRDGKNPQNQDQSNIDHQVPGPFEIKLRL